MKKILDKAKKSRVLKYLKNLGLSSKEIIKKTIEDNDAYFMGTQIADEIREWNENRKSQPKVGISKKLKEKFWNYIDKDRFEEGSYKDDIKKIKDTIVKGITTGDWREKDKNDFFSIIDEDPDYLFVDDPDFPIGESYFKGGKMNITALRDEYLKNLRIVAKKESLEVLSPIEPLNDKVEELKDRLIKDSEYVDSTVRDEISDVSRDTEYTDIKDKILNIISVVSSNPKIENNYKDVLADELAVLFLNQAKYKSSNPHVKHYTDDIKISPDNIKGDLSAEMSIEKNDLLDKIDKAGATSISTKLEEKIGSVPEIVEADIEKTVLPEPSEEDLSATVVASSASAQGEDFNMFGMASGIITALVALVAIPVNLVNQKVIDDMEKKYGTNFTFKQPMVVSDNISSDTASKYSKAIEVKQLAELKGLIESTVARQDGGSVISRAMRGSKLLSPMNVEFKDGVQQASDGGVSYDEIISAFSESGRPFFKPIAPIYSTALNSFTYTAVRESENYSLINNLDCLVSKGESGEFIDLKRNALPSYMEVNIDYTFAESPIDLKQKKQTRKTTMGLQILPRKIASSDILKTLDELNMKYFDSIVVTKDERNFIKKAKNMLTFWKKKGTKNEIKALKSNSFSDIVNKISNVKSPLFHLVISYPDYMELKNLGTDLMDRTDYSRVMTRLPLISLTIIDEDSDILYLSEGPTMSYIRHSLEDFVDTVSQYEKDLKTIIKYNQM